MRGAARMILIVCAGFLLPVAGLAQRMGIHGHLGYAFQEEGNLRGEFESGFGFTYPLADRFRISFEFSRWKAEARSSAHVLDNGTVTVSPVIACLQYEFPANRFFIPYAFAGGAFVFAKFRIGTYIAIPEVRIDQTIENGPAFYFGMGARIPLSRAISFFSEASYLMRTAPGKTIIKDMNFGLSEEPILVNLRSVLIKFGLKLFF